MNPPGPEVTGRCGPWSWRLDTADAAVRDLRWHDVPVLQAITAPVRLPDWSTVPAEVGELREASAGGGREISWQVRCRGGGADFAWRGELRVHPKGELRYTFDGEARQSFARARIGCCVLHDAACAGQACTIEHTDGRRIATAFPAAIAPHQPFLDVRALTHAPAPGVTVEVRLLGETFETEDQRNWTDPSFKTYCTPLARPHPVVLTPGEPVRQTVQVSARGTPHGTAPAWLPPPARPHAAPAIGTCLAPAAAHHPDQLRLARTLRLAFLRWELDLRAPHPHPALAQADCFGGDWQLGLRIPRTPTPAQLERLAAVAAHVPMLFRHVMVSVVDAEMPEPAVLPALRTALGRAATGARWIMTSDENFTELNRARPPATAWDGVGFAFNPQMHAFDDDSIRGTLRVLPHLVAQAREIYPEVEVHAGPVRFTPRRDPRPDPRLRSTLGARWTRDAVAALRAGGALASICLHDLAALADGPGAPLARAFAALPRAGGSQDESERSR